MKQDSYEERCQAVRVLLEGQDDKIEKLVKSLKKSELHTADINTILILLEPEVFDTMVTEMVNNLVVKVKSTLAKARTLEDKNGSKDEPNTLKQSTPACSKSNDTEKSLTVEKVLTVFRFGLILLAMALCGVIALKQHRTALQIMLRIYGIGKPSSESNRATKSRKGGTKPKKTDNEEEIKKAILKSIADLKEIIKNNIKKLRALQSKARTEFPKMTEEAREKRTSKREDVTRGKPFGTEQTNSESTSATSSGTQGSNNGSPEQTTTTSEFESTSCEDHTTSTPAHEPCRGCAKDSDTLTKNDETVILRAEAISQNQKAEADRMGQSNIDKGECMSKETDSKELSVSEEDDFENDSLDDDESADDDFENDEAIIAMEKAADDLARTCTTTARRDSDKRNQQGVLNFGSLTVHNETLSLLFRATSDPSIKGRKAQDDRPRLHCVLKIVTINQIVETLTTNCDEKYYGDTSIIGPKGCSYTWGTFATMMELYAGVYMPTNRIEKLYCGEIDRDMILRMAENFANSFLPVYEYFAKDIIANAQYINCDDGITRVNSVQRLRKEIKHAKAKLLMNVDMDSAIDEMSFSKIIDHDQKWIKIPGFNSDSIVFKMNELSSLFKAENKSKDEPIVNKDQSKKRKIEQWLVRDDTFKIGVGENRKKICYINALKGTPKLQTSVIICEDNTYNSMRSSRYDIRSNQPISYKETGNVIFYKTDFKSCGELIGSFLSRRQDKTLAVTIQSDLSAENNVKNCATPIVYAGCMAHARRPFYRFKQDEPDLCDLVLGNFSSIANAEQMMQEHTLTPAQIVKHRTEFHGILWRASFEVCRLFQPLWSSSTELGKAIDYLINHQQKLMHYCSDPFVSLTNNVSEHWLRQEALHDSSSFGCASLQGRVHFDLARTAYASAAASQVRPQEYFVFVMIADRADIEAHPERYSPMAYRQWMEKELIKGEQCPCCGAIFDDSDGRSLYGITSCLKECALRTARRTRAVVMLEVPEDMKMKQ